jgi:alkylation response protein AidB-like acyl-CoA dehydrogenase
VKVDGGCSITGQKIWTSAAEYADRGLATMRTDVKAAKREGITTVVIDLKAPGVTVRPLRELTGLALFNDMSRNVIAERLLGLPRDTTAQ